MNSQMIDEKCVGEKVSEISFEVSYQAQVW